MKLKQSHLLCIYIFLLTSCNNNSNSNTSKDSTETNNSELKVAVNTLKDCYFGDLHLHSSYSADAFAMGARMTPEDAYHWAEGKTHLISWH
jgi:Protein of unknown function (DUF3604)